MNRSQILEMVVANLMPDEAGRLAANILDRICWTGGRGPNGIEAFAQELSAVIAEEVVPLLHEQHNIGQ